MTFVDDTILYAADLNEAVAKHVETLTAGESLADGDLVYLKSDGKMWKADADAETTANTLLGIATEALDADAEGVFLIKGKYTTTGLTAGSIYFVSTTAGEWTDTVPSGSGDIIRVVGYALSTTVLYFTPDVTYIEV